MSVIPLRPLHFDVNRVPLVVISGANPLDPVLHMRRYIGRLCTHEGELQNGGGYSRKDVLELIEMFREDPVRAFGGNRATAPAERPVSA